MNSTLSSTPATPLKSAHPPFGAIWQRAVASMIDWFILLTMAGLGHVMWFGIGGLGGLLLYFMYEPILIASPAKATLGKYIMEIEVTGLSGERVTLKAAFIRSLLKLVSASLMFSGHFVALLSSKRQAVHDMIADTLVVHGKEDVNFFEAWIGEMKRLFSQ